MIKQRNNFIIVCIFFFLLSCSNSKKKKIKKNIYLIVNHANGLVAESKILHKGVVIGSVKNVSLLNYNDVIIELNLDSIKTLPFNEIHFELQENLFDKNSLEINYGEEVGGIKIHHWGDTIKDKIKKKKTIKIDSIKKVSNDFNQLALGLKEVLDSIPYIINKLGTQPKSQK